MKKSFLKTILIRFVQCSALLLVAFSSLAQADSLTVVHTKWETRKVARGIVLKHFWFDHTLFGSNQNINILEVELKGKNQVDVEADPQQLKPASEFGQEYNAIAAINGTFFDMKNGGSVDYIRLNGKTLNENRLPKSNKRALHQKAAIVIDHNHVSIEQWDGSENWEEKLKGDDIMETGPLLIKADQLVQLDSVNFNTARHPRTAVALKGNKLLLVAVDGRNEKAAGMSLFELSRFLHWLKTDDAINLDGGGSTTLWVKTYPFGGIVNHPSDNRKMMQSKDYKPGMDLDAFPSDNKWDHSGERPVANVIIVKAK